MKVLVNGDITDKLEMYNYLGIKVLQEVKRGETVSYVLEFPENFKIKKGVGPKVEYLTEDVAYPYMAEYISSGDCSLNDFVICGMNIVASGDFVAQEEDSLYDYEVVGSMRVYNDKTINTINYTLSSENDISGYHEFIENMLSSSTERIIDERRK